MTENGLKTLKSSSIKVRAGAAFVLGLAGFDVWIANIVDAYKGDRKKAVPADNPPQKTETQQKTETEEQTENTEKS